MVFFVILKSSMSRQKTIRRTVPMENEPDHKLFI